MTDDLPQLPFPRPSVLDIAPLYRTLAVGAPITPVRTAAGDVAWLVTGYAEVEALLADPRLGVPYEDRDQFRIWSAGIGNLTDRQASTAALGQLVAYMRQLIPHKRAHPGQDVISDLIAAQSQGHYGDDGIAKLAAALLFAGHETTVTRIDFGTLLLLTHPGQRDALRDDPELVTSAVEEILRMAAPGGSGVPRYAHEDIDLAGLTIRTGDAVLLTSLTANRDGVTFRDLDRFDITRTPHLSFGYGPPLLPRGKPRPPRTPRCLQRVATPCPHSQVGSSPGGATAARWPAHRRSHRAPRHLVSSHLEADARAGRLALAGQERGTECGKSRYFSME